MSFELFTVIINANFIVLVGIGIIYYALDIKAMSKLTWLLILVDLFARIIHKPLFQIENVKAVWYLVWATVNFVSLLIIVKITKENPQIQKISIPIAILVLIGSFITVGRHFERNFLNTNYLKEIYGISDVTVSWLILAYLFAPIALLLVKFIRSRFTAKH